MESTRRGNPRQRTTIEHGIGWWEPRAGDRSGPLTRSAMRPSAMTGVRWHERLDGRTEFPAAR